MTKNTDLFRLEEERDSLRRQLAEVGDLRPGSLTARYRECGKANCRCAREGAKGHGPSWSLTRRVEGRTRTRVIPAGEEVERTRRQIGEHRRFRRLAAEFVEASERLCQARLEAAGGIRREPQKEGSAKRSGGKSGKRRGRS